MRAMAPLPFGWSDLDGPTEMAKVEALLVQMAGCLPRQTLVNWKIITPYYGYSSFHLQLAQKKWYMEQRKRHATYKRIQHNPNAA